MAQRLALGLPTAASAALTGAAPARAHAFGARYDLPLPLDLYLAGAGSAVALSFVVMAVFFRASPRRRRQSRIDLLRFRPARVLLHPAFLAVPRTISVGLFVLVAAAGSFGAQDTLRNFAPTFIWVIWWVGLAYVAALAGNLWAAINPWSVLFVVFEKIVRRIGGRDRLDLGLSYPSWLGVWPAVLTFALFAWFELVAETSREPSTLAAAVLIYSGICWLGMAAYGRETWLAHGEAFSLAFAVLARFAPIDRPKWSGRDGGIGHWHLRPYAAGLITDRPCRLSMTVFVLLMLSTVTYDGFKETPLHAGLLVWVASEPFSHPSILALHESGFDFIATFDVVLLAVFPILFLMVYWAFAWLTKEFADSKLPVAETAGLFVFSLVPIAIAYHLAHYLSYLLIAGQRIIPLISDPFGMGWDVFGTAAYRINIAIVDAEFAWYSAVIAIVVGHVFAVAVAHFTALRVFRSPGVAHRSQYPLLVLMVAYTMLSLWILAQPIVESPNPRTLRAPSGTMSLAPYEFQELCLELAADEEVRFEFQADRPIKFNIHYHEGFAIRIPVQLGVTTRHADKFVADIAQTYCLMWRNHGVDRATLRYRVGRP